MEKIFYINAEMNEALIKAYLKEINDFIRDGGSILSVTPNAIHSNVRGGWLVVAEGPDKGVGYNELKV
jgi:hypothetical protein